jgi:hypothetical protein
MPEIEWAPLPRWRVPDRVIAAMVLAAQTPVPAFHRYRATVFPATRVHYDRAHNRHARRNPSFAPLWN